MSKSMKRFLSLVLAFVMVLSYVPVNAFAEESVMEEPVAEEPVAEEPVAEEPVAEEPVAEEPVVEDPIEEPVEEEPVEDETADGSAGESAAEETEAAEIAYAVETFTTEGEVATLDMYLEKLFWPESVPSVYAGSSAGEKLGDGLERSLYELLKQNIVSVADGSLTSTAFSVPGARIAEWGATAVYTIDESVTDVDAWTSTTGAEFVAQFDFAAVHDALINDCPYEMYWYGNAYQFGYSAAQENSTVTFNLEIAFLVTTDMRDTSGGPDTDPNTLVASTAVTAAASAKATADTVVANAAHKTDLEILKDYRNEILSRVSYDDTAAASGNPSLDNDPWQIIAVFDNDTSTNVVCEGYAKAFQYLCEQTTAFDGKVTSYLVTGTTLANNETTPENHMWNVVNIDGSSYLVDVTNCDEDAIGTAEGLNLFLAGGTANADGSYTFTDGDQNTITYTYDASSKNLLGDALTLAESDYISDGGDTELDGAVLTQEIIDALESGEGLTITENTSVVGAPLVLPENFTLTVTNGAVLDLASGPAQIAVVDNASIVFEDDATFTRDNSSDPMVPFYVFVNNGATVTGGGVANADIWAQYTANSEAEIRTYLTEAAESGYAKPEVRTGRDLTIELTSDLTIPAGVTLRPECVGTELVIPEGKTLTVEAGAAMNLRGDGEVHNYGTIVNNGTVTVNEEEGCVLYNYGTIQGNDVPAVGTYTIDIYAEKYVSGQAPVEALLYSKVLTEDMDAYAWLYSEEISAAVQAEITENYPNCLWSYTYRHPSSGTLVTEADMQAEGNKKVCIQVTQAVARLGDDGQLFPTLGQAIAAAEALSDEERPYVALLTDFTLGQTMQINKQLALYGKDPVTGENTTHTLTGPASLESMFQLNAGGQIIVGGVDMTTQGGKYIFKLTADDSEVLLNPSNLSGATEAAIYIAEGVDYVVRDNVVNGQVFKSANVQIYNSNISAASVVIANGTNSQISVVGFGDENNAAKVLTANSAAGVYVLNGSGHTVLNQGARLVNTAENGVAFTMTGDSTVLTADPWFNDVAYPPTGNPMPNSGAVARVDVWYYGSLQPALDFAKDCDYGDSVNADYVLAVDVLKDVTVTSGLTLDDCVYPICLTMAGNSTLTIPAGQTFCVYENLKVVGNVVNNGTIRNYAAMNAITTGSFANNGSIINVSGGTFAYDENVAFTGNAPETAGNVTLTLVDGENTSTLTIPVGDQVGDSLPDGTQTGAFAGWFSEENGGGTQLTADTVVTADMATTYYAGYATGVVRLGEDGPTYDTLEAAIAAAAEIPGNERPSVMLLAGVTVSETIEIENAIHLVGVPDSNGRWPIVTAGEGVDVLFHITGLGGMLLNEVNLHNYGENGVVFQLDSNQATVQMSDCWVESGKAAIHVPATVEYVDQDAEGNEATAIQVYSSSLQGNYAAILIEGSNTKTVVAKTSDSVNQMVSHGADGVIVLKGKDNLVHLYAGNLWSDPAAGVEQKGFTLSEGCEILMGANYNGYFYSPHDPDSNLQTVPSSGVVARVDVNYFGSLQDAFDYAASVEPYDNVAEDYKIEVVLQQDIEISDHVVLNETVYPVRLNLNGHEMTVKTGGTLQMYPETYLAGGNLRLDVPGKDASGDWITLLWLGDWMTIEDSANVYAEQMRGAIWFEGDINVNGEIIKLHTLSSRWLSYEYDESTQTDYIYEDTNNALDEYPGVSAAGTGTMIFYLNTWNEETGEYESEPVVPANGGSKAYRISKAANPIREGEVNGDYFMSVTASGSLYGSYEPMTVMKDGKTLEFTFSIYDRTFAFYTTPEPSVETIINDGQFHLDANAEENAFYAVLLTPDNCDIVSFEYGVETWGEDYDSYVTDGEVVSMTRVSGKEGVYKFEIDPEFVEYTRHEWKNFNLWIENEIQFQGEDWTNPGRMDIWVQPAEQSDETPVSFWIDKSEYQAYESGLIIGNLPQYDENGQVTDFKWMPTSLPDGVSYDYASNTMTLKDARLNQLYLQGKEAQIQDEETIWQDILPGGKMTLVLEGYSEITNHTGSALELENVMLNIAGGGEVALNSINSPDNLDEGGYNYAFHTVQLNNSTLTIGEDAIFGVTVDGVGYWNDGNKAELYGINGNDEGGNYLIIRDNANVQVQQEWPHHETDNRDENAGQYRAIANLDGITVEGGKLTATNIYLNGGTFIQTSGEVNVNPRGRVENWPPRFEESGTDATAPILYYEGLRVENGTVNITGGQMNLGYHNVGVDFSAFGDLWLDGISLCNTTMNFSGGTIYMQSDLNWTSAIVLNGMSDDEGNTMEGSGGALNMSGDANLVFIGHNGENIVNNAIWSGDVSALNLNGGRIEATDCQLVSYGVLNLNGTVIEGDSLRLQVLDDGYAKMTMSGGELYIYDGGVLELNGDVTFSGGEVNMTNAETYINGNTTITGNTIFSVGNDNADLGNGYCAVEVNGSLTIEADEKGNEPVVNIEVTAYAEGTDEEGNEWETRPIGIFLTGDSSYTQNAGEVNISDSVRYAMYSEGNVTLNGGNLNLRGFSGFAHEAAHSCDEATVRTFVVNDGMYVNVDVENVGMYLAVDATVNGGSIDVISGGNAVLAAFNNVHWDEDGNYTLCDQQENTASLEILGGAHNFNAGIFGLMVDESVSVKILNSETGNSPVLTVSGGTAGVMVFDETYIDAAHPENTVLTDLVITENGEEPVFLATSDEVYGSYYVLADSEGNVATELNMNYVKTLKDWLSDTENQPDEYGWYHVTDDVVVYGSTNLMLNGQYINVMIDQGGSLTVKNGGTLIIPNGSSLKSNGSKQLDDGSWKASKITVDAGGTLYNYGYLGCDHAEITVNGTYKYGETAKVENLYHVGLNGDSEPQVFKGTISGIADNLIRLYGCINGEIGVSSLEQLKLVDDYADDGYHSVELWTDSDLEFSEDYTLPAKMYLSVDSSRLTDEGELIYPAVVVKTNLTIEAGAKLSLGTAILAVEGALVNNGEIATDIHDAADILIQAAGTLTNNGSITLNHANVDVQGTMEVGARTDDSYPNVMINGCSTLTVAEGGTLNNYNAIHVGYWKPSGDEITNIGLNATDFEGMAGTLVINGTMNNYAYLCPAPISDSFGGEVIVNGTLNNAVLPESAMMGMIENHGNIEVSGTLTNERSQIADGVGYMASVWNYGDVTISGRLENNAQFWIQDDEFASANLIAKEGAYVYNGGSLRNRSENGWLDLSSADYSGTGEVGQDYFENGKLSKVSINGLDNSGIILIYEGSTAAVAMNMQAYADRMDYKSADVTVNGDMTIPAGDTMTVGGNDILQIAPGASVTVEGSIVNLGKLTVNGSQPGYDANGNLTTIPAAELIVARADDGSWAGKVYNEGTMLVSGTLENNGMVENWTTGTIEMNGTYIPGTAAILCNDLEDGSLGTINNIDKSQQMLWTRVLTSEDALRSFMNTVTTEGYAAGEVWVIGDLKITDTLNVPANVTIVIASPGSLTVNENGYMGLEGSLEVFDGAKLTVNGTLRLAEVEDAELVGRNGATIEVNGTLVNGATINNLFGSTIVNNGTINNKRTFINAGDYLPGTKAVLKTIYGMDEYGDMKVFAIAGVVKSDITLVHELHDEVSAQDLIALLQNDHNVYGYRDGILLVNGQELALTQDMTIPENLTIEVFNDGSLVVAENVTLRNDGLISLLTTYRMNENNEMVLTGADLVSNGSIAADSTGVWEATGGDLTWKLKKGTLIVNGPITEVTWEAVKGLVNRIELGIDVKEVPTGAFTGCNVSVVQIPENVTTVAAGAFDDTVTLKVHHEQTINHPEDKIQIQHTLDADGKCTYEGCDYDLHVILDGKHEVVGEDSGDIIEAVKSFDTEYLRDSMYDAETGEETDVMEKIEKHEEEIQKKREEDGGQRLDVNATVNDGASQEIHDHFGDVSGEHIKGAVANAAEGVSEVKLIIGDPEEMTREDLDPRESNTETAVLFSMTMEGVTDASALDVPVKITLPIPDGIDPDRIMIRHYHGDSMEYLTPFVSADKRTVSFYMTRFSDVDISNKVIPVTIKAADEIVKYGQKPVLNYSIVDENGDLVTTDFGEKMKVLDANGNVMTDLTALPAGTYTISPTYTDVAGYSVSVETAELTVSKWNTTVAAILDKTEVVEGYTGQITVNVIGSEEVTDGGYTIKKGEETIENLNEAVKVPGEYTIIPNCDLENERYAVTVQTATLTVTAKAYGAQIGESMYETLQDAVNEAADGATIELLRSGEIAMAGKSLTIVKNGHTVMIAALADYTVVESEDKTAYIVKKAVAEPEVDDAPKAAYIVGDESNLMTLQDALNAAAKIASKDNVKTVKLTQSLTGDNAVGTVIIPSYVVLNIESYTLEAERVIGLTGSILTANTMKGSTKDGSGYLWVSKNNLSLDEGCITNSGGYGILPVWNGDWTDGEHQGRYEFAQLRATMHLNSHKLSVTEDLIELVFRHQTNSYYKNYLLNDGGVNNGVKVIVTLSWEGTDGVANQTYVYKDNYFKDVNNASDLDYFFRLNQYELLGVDLSREVTIYAAVVTDCGMTHYIESLDVILN